MRVREFGPYIPKLAALALCGALLLLGSQQPTKTCFVRAMLAIVLDMRAKLHLFSLQNTTIFPTSSPFSQRCFSQRCLCSILVFSSLILLLGGDDIAHAADSPTTIKIHDTEQTRKPEKSGKSEKSEKSEKSKKTTVKYKIRKSFFVYIDDDGTVHATDNPDDMRAEWFNPFDLDQSEMIALGTPHRGEGYNNYQQYRQLRVDDDAGYGPESFLYDKIIGQAAQRYHLPFGLIKAVIAVESSFNASAKSPAGAMGLMQLMPKTAEHLGVGNAFNPAENIDGGSKYLANMLAQFGDLKTALAAYNAGPKRVADAGGIPQFPETLAYIDAVLDLSSRFRARAISLTPPPTPPTVAPPPAPPTPETEEIIYFGVPDS